MPAYSDLLTTDSKGTISDLHRPASFSRQGLRGSVHHKRSNLRPKVSLGLDGGYGADASWVCWKYQVIQLLLLEVRSSGSTSYCFLLLAQVDFDLLNSRLSDQRQQLERIGSAFTAANLNGPSQFMHSSTMQPRLRMLALLLASACCAHTALAQLPPLQPFQPLQPLQPFRPLAPMAPLPGFAPFPDMPQMQQMPNFPGFGRPYTGAAAAGRAGPGTYTASSSSSSFAGSGSSTAPGEVAACMHAVQPAQSSGSRPRLWV